MADNAIIIKSDGTPTTTMKQPQVQIYIVNVLSNQQQLNKQACFKQALNDVFAPAGGKATGTYTYKGLPVLHASSGTVQVSATLFFTVTGGVASIFAMGEHGTTEGAYKISVWGQDKDKDNVYAKGKTLTI